MNFVQLGDLRFANVSAHPEMRVCRNMDQQAAAQGMAPWFESVGLVPQDAQDVARFCVRQQIFDVLSLCMMPEESLCEALGALPFGQRQFVPMIIKAARSSKATREHAPLTPSRTTTTEWMRNVGFDAASAAIIGSALEANHMRSKGLVLAQEPAELELVAGRLPAPAKHAFLAVVRDARSQEQFTLGPPPRLIPDKWCAPVKPYLVELGIFDDVTIRQIEAACGQGALKIRCRWSLFAMEDAELSSALTVAKLPPIVQRALINSINAEADRSETQWVVDKTRPGEAGQVTIYKHQEERLAAEAETYEPAGCCGFVFGGKCRKCGKPRADHFTPAFYCIDSKTRGSSSQDTSTLQGVIAAHLEHAPSSAPAGLAQGKPPLSLRPDTFYHATSAENALRIQEHGFVIPDGPGGLLGRGVYCTSTLTKAMDYLKGPHGGVILELKIDLGNCKQLVEGDPMMNTWQNHYDSAWAPFSAVNPGDQGKEENCVKDPKSIKVVQAIAGSTGQLKQGGFVIEDGKLRKVIDAPR